MPEPAITRSDLIDNLGALLSSVEEAGALGAAIQRGWNPISDVTRLAYRLADSGGRLRELIDAASAGGYLENLAEPLEHLSGYAQPTGLGFRLPEREER